MGANRCLGGGRACWDVRSQESGADVKLYDNWREILRRAWSVRFAALAAIFSGAEALLPLYSEVVPRGVFAGLSGLLTVAAIWARAVYQKDV